MTVLAHGFLVGVRARLLLLKVFLRYGDAIHDAVTTSDVGDRDLFLDTIEISTIPGAPPVARWWFKHGWDLDTVWTPFWTPFWTPYHMSVMVYEWKK